MCVCVCVLFFSRGTLFLSLRGMEYKCDWSHQKVERQCPFKGQRHREEPSVQEISLLISISFLWRLEVCATLLFCGTVSYVSLQISESTVCLFFITRVFVIKYRYCFSFLGGFKYKTHACLIFLWLLKIHSSCLLFHF